MGVKPMGAALVNLLYKEPSEFQACTGLVARQMREALLERDSLARKLAAVETELTTLREINNRIDCGPRLSL